MPTDGDDLDQLRANANASCVESALKLADLYRRGVGVQIDVNEARKWLRAAIAINPGAVVEWYFQHEPVDPKSPDPDDDAE